MECDIFALPSFCFLKEIYSEKVGWVRSCIDSKRIMQESEKFMGEQRPTVLKNFLIVVQE
jgi:hypothetical protein